MVEDDSSNMLLTRSTKGVFRIGPTSLKDQVVMKKLN